MPQTKNKVTKINGLCVIKLWITKVIELFTPYNRLKNQTKFIKEKNIRGKFEEKLPNSFSSARTVNGVEKPSSQDNQPLKLLQAVQQIVVIVENFIVDQIVMNFSFLANNERRRMSKNDQRPDGSGDYLIFCPRCPHRSDQLFFFVKFVKQNPSENVHDCNDRVDDHHQK
jgi:hypothetical protein